MCHSTDSTQVTNEALQKHLNWLTHDNENYPKIRTETDPIPDDSLTKRLDKLQDNIEELPKTSLSKASIEESVTAVIGNDFQKCFLQIQENTAQETLKKIVAGQLATMETSLIDEITKVMEESAEKTKSLINVSFGNKNKHDDLTYKLEKAKEDLADEKILTQSLNEKVVKLESDNKTLRMEKIALEEKKSEYFTKYREKKAELEQEQTEITKLQNNLKEETASRKDLQEKIAVALESLESITSDGLTLGKRVNNVFGIHQNLKQEVADLKEQLIKKQGEYERKVSELEGEHKTAVSRLEGKLETEKDKVSESQGRLKATAQKFSGFDNLVIPYVELAEKVQAAPSTRDLLRNCSPVNEGHPDNIVIFISYVANERGFAVEIYNAMRKYQSETKIGMEKADHDVVKALNEFYQKRDNIEFEVMKTPEEKQRFNHKNVQDLEKPANTRFRDYSTVYVPAIMKDETTVSFQAVVKGNT